MFQDEGFSLRPTNFFQIQVDCHEINEKFPTLTKAKETSFLLPETSSLTNEEIFAYLSMGWSKDGLAFFVEVETLVSHVSYPDVKKGDSLELFIDTRDIKTSGYNTKFCHHFFFLPEAVEGHMKGEITKFRTEDAHELSDPNDLKLNVKKKSDRYQMEIFIPKQSIFGYDPDQFNRLGFTYRVNRYQDLPQHFSTVSSEYQIEEQPSLWSRLNLVK